MNDPGSLLKVRYVGQRAGSFSVTVAGITRHWSTRPLGQTVAVARWLPKVEAEGYRQLPDFEVLEPEAAPQPRQRKKKKVVEVKPEPPAVSVEEYVARKRPVPFVMSKAGIVHRRECSRCPKVPIAEFESVAEAREHSRFSRFHRSCIE